MGSFSPLLLRPSAIFATPTPPEPKPNGDQRDDSWAAALVTDVYHGLSGVAHGEAKYLQIMEQVPKTRKLARHAYDQAPVIGYGTYYVKRCWGRVPIEPDGSAHFLLPAMKEVYLQVLDAEGRELQRQTSSIQVAPAKRASCIGCHEPRNAAPPSPPPCLWRPGSRPLGPFRPPGRTTGGSIS